MRLHCKRNWGCWVVATGCMLAWWGHGCLAFAGGETALREAAAQRIEWQSQEAATEVLPLKLLAINDFHSQLSAGLTVDGRPVGSAPVLASYLQSLEKEARGATIILHAGDHVGASQPQSALLQDEPGVMFFNMLGNEQCRTQGRYGAGCNLIGIPGNHELDEGPDEMLRLIRGGNHAQGPFLEQPYQGAAFPYICANLVYADSGRPVFPPYVIHQIDGTSIAFIGALLRQASSFLSPQSLEGLQVLDEAETINRYVSELQSQGIHTVVAVIHQGGAQYQRQASAAGSAVVFGDIVPLVARLDTEVDVVFAGHTHTFHNAFFERDGGKKMLVVQAWPKGTGLADVDLTLSRKTGDVVAIGSRIVTTWADQGAGLRPDARVAGLTRQTEEAGNALASQVIAQATKPITRAANAAGESALGDLVADAYRRTMKADFAFIDADGLHADLDPGQITKATPYSVQPYHLNLIRLELTGRQIYALLNQQWSKEEEAERRLQVSGLTYTWDAKQPVGQRIVTVMRDGQPLGAETCYTVAVNEYLAGGGGRFTVLTQGRNPVVGPFVAEALGQYVAAHPQPISAPATGRISRLN